MYFCGIEDFGPRVVAFEIPRFRHGKIGGERLCLRTVSMSSVRRGWQHAAHGDGRSLTNGVCEDGGNARRDAKEKDADV